MAAVPRITGGGLPYLNDSEAAFLEPMVVHEGGDA